MGVAVGWGWGGAEVVVVLFGIVVVDGGGEWRCVGGAGDGLRDREGALSCRCCLLSIELLRLSPEERSLGLGGRATPTVAELGCRNAEDAVASGIIISGRARAEDWPLGLGRCGSFTRW